MSNQKIIDFINSIKDNYTNEINEEINILFNNLIIDEECSNRLNISNSIYAIFGVSGIINYIDYTYLIPNLFRKCYLNDSFNIPNICVNYIDTANIKYYYPNLLDDKYIKSFLYYNAPASYKNISYFNNALLSIINLEKYVNTKKVNLTYRSITPSTVIFSNIYSSESMLMQLLMLNNFLNTTNNDAVVDKIIKPFKIKWDYTTGCINKTTKKYTIGVYNNNNIINSSTSKILNHLRYTPFNNFDKIDINYNAIVRIFKSNIYKIMELALEVQQDVLLQINYYLKSKSYCVKDYMHVKNIPFLIKLYKNFYNNQIKTIQDYIPFVTVEQVIPVNITLTALIANFKAYFNDYLGTVLKTVKISTTEALLLCSNSVLHWIHLQLHVLIIYIII